MIRILDRLSESDIIPADDFVKSNLGMILHNDNAYFKSLFILKKDVADESMNINPQIQNNLLRR